MTTSTRPQVAQPRTEIAYEANGFVYAALSNIGIAIFGTKANVENIRELPKITIDLVSEYGCTSTIYIAVRSMPIPDAEARALLQQQAAELATHLVAVANVIGGDGFYASAIRGFVTSLHWIGSGHKHFNMRVFPRFAAAAHWLAAEHSAKSLAIDGADLEREVACLLERPSLKRF